MKKDFMFTSESVTEGHPDKLCDQISDAIVDRFLEQEKNSRVSAECAVSTAVVFISARFASSATVDFPNVARKIIEQIGYGGHDFNARTCSVLTSLQELGRDERSCFDEGQLSEEEIERITARNQATVFGFACNQTPALMPLPIWLARKLSKRLAAVRRNGTLPYLTPDGKTQVGVEYRGGRVRRIHSVTITAAQRSGAEPSLRRLRDDLRGAVIDAVFQDEAVKPDRRTEIFINPDGLFVTGGPSTHSGLTGRKNAIDTYGGYSRHSGTALSGKDPTRIDRVGAYGARSAAKNVVAAGLADECEVQLSYSIGRSRPVSIQVETFGSGRLPEEAIAKLLERNVDFRLAGIIRQFRLRQLPAAKGGFFRRLAAYGHVGRTDMELPWEATDKTLPLQG
jgi:S-adenosylmethionine synthetase